MMTRGMTMNTPTLSSFFSSFIIRLRLSDPHGPVNRRTHVLVEIVVPPLDKVRAGAREHDVSLVQHDETVRQIDEPLRFVGDDDDGAVIARAPTAERPQERLGIEQALALQRVLDEEQVRIDPLSATGRRPLQWPSPSSFISRSMCASISVDVILE
jgi:hypothetical protein